MLPLNAAASSNLLGVGAILQPLDDADARFLGGLKLLGRLGIGGMGVVYLASQPDGELVALKVVRADLTADPEFRRRFIHEVRNGMRVNGPFLAQVLEASTSGTPQFVVSRYVSGENLAESVRGHGELDDQETQALAVGTADALARLHAAGIVHRDVKPSNVQLGPTGPVLLDLGVSKAADATSPTRSGKSVGSPAWMSPEQLRGTGETAASDVWNWAALVAFAAGGKHPFGAGTGEALAYRIVHESPVIPLLPEPLAGLVERALARDPGMRPTAEEVLDGLECDLQSSTGYVAERWARFAPLAASDLPTMVAPTSPEHTAVTQLAPTRVQVTPAAHLPQSRRWSSGLIAALVVAALLLVGGVGAYALTRGGSEPGDLALSPPEVSTSPVAAPDPQSASPSPSTVAPLPSTPVVADAIPAIPAFEGTLPDTQAGSDQFTAWLRKHRGDAVWLDVDFRSVPGSGAASPPEGVIVDHVQDFCPENEQTIEGYCYPFAIFHVYSDSGSNFGASIAHGVGSLSGFFIVEGSYLAQERGETQELTHISGTKAAEVTGGGRRDATPTHPRTKGGTTAVASAVTEPASTLGRPLPAASSQDSSIWVADYVCQRGVDGLPTLKPGSAESTATQALQVILDALGYSPGPIDGDYGPVTQKAVKEFQSDNEIIVDAKVGPQTWGVIRGDYC